MSLEQELITLKQTIEEANATANRLVGQLDELQKQYKKAGVNNTKEAEQKIEELHKEIERLEDKLKAGAKKIRDRYGL